MTSPEILLTHLGWPATALDRKGRWCLMTHEEGPPQLQASAVILRNATRITCRVTAEYPPESPARLLEGVWSCEEDGVRLVTATLADKKEGVPVTEEDLLKRFTFWLLSLGGAPRFQDMGPLVSEHDLTHPPEQEANKHTL